MVEERQEVVSEPPTGDSGPAIEVMVPHDRRDYRRVGIVILLAGIPLDLVAWHFLRQDTPQDLHGGIFFAFGGLLLHGVGAVIAFRAFFGSLGD